MFIINCKNYEEAGGISITRIISGAKTVAKRYGINIAVAPPQQQLGLVAGCGIPVLAQHVDDADVGSTTGYVVPKLLKKSGIKGSIVNHSEHRIPARQIANIVARLKELNMISIVCVRNVAEARKYARLAPNYIAIEPPELIGSGKAISRERPELITRAVSAVQSARNKTKLLCGAGITSGQDVAMAMELGSDGILVASGIVKAKNPNKMMGEFAKSMI